MKRWLLTCGNPYCEDYKTPYAVYSLIEPVCCLWCGYTLIKAVGFRRVKGIPVSEVLERGIYRAPILG